MKNKTTLAAFITAILLSSSAAYAAGDRTISLGYAQGDVDSVMEIEKTLDWTMILKGLMLNISIS